MPTNVYASVYALDCEVCGRRLKVTTNRDEAQGVHYCPEHRPTVIESTETPPPTATISATEAALKLAEEYGIDLSQVTGTGQDGRITKADVEELIDAE